MISLPIGVILISAVLGLALEGMNFAVLLNEHSIILVIGGTTAVLALSMPWHDVRDLFVTLVRLWRPQRNTRAIYEGLIEVAKKRNATLPNSHPLLKYAQDLWAQGLDPEIFAFLINQRREELNSASERVVAAVRNLAKYPPAMGMTGTVIGMVSIFSNLTADNRSKLGPSLALAMTATFYGLVLSNMILLPLADRLHVLHLGRKKTNEYIYRALILIQRGEPESVLNEEVNAAAA